jgi:hypothetical protein
MRCRLPRASLAPDGFAVDALDSQGDVVDISYDLDHCSQFALPVAEEAAARTAAVHSILSL